MENKFLDTAVSIVKQAVDADKAKNYEEAFNLYKKALEHFMIGLKCTFYFQYSFIIYKRSNL